MSRSIASLHRAALVIAALVIAVLAAAIAPRPAAAAKTRPPHEPKVPLAVPGAPRLPRLGKPAPPAPRPLPATLNELLETTPAESLAAPLRRFEAEHGRTPAGAEAAFTLGQFHFARGEYHQAGDAFGRAAARYSPERKPEARYWQGLSALGAGEPVQARAALEEVVRSGSARGVEARFGVAETWEKAGRPDRAAETLRALLADGAGDMTAPALERLAAISLQLGDADAARRASAELQRTRPASIEATRLPETPRAPEPAPPRAAPTEPARVGVQIGAFADPGRARVLMLAARRAGFERTVTVRQGQGGTELHLVRIGFFATEAEAREAGERASRELGVAYRLIRNP